MALSLFEFSEIQNACRRGRLYEKHGSQESSIVCAEDEPVALLLIQQFRGKVYSEDGPIPAVVNGVNVQEGDELSYHVIVVENKHRLIGCCRYQRIFVPAHLNWVRLGGFAITKTNRGSRVILKIIHKIIEMAHLFGDKRLFAHANINYNSSKILQKLGGVKIATYYQEDYKANVDVLKFILPDEPEAWNDGPHMDGETRTDKTKTTSLLTKSHETQHEKYPWKQSA